MCEKPNKIDQTMLQVNSLDAFAEILIFLHININKLIYFVCWTI